MFWNKYLVDLINLTCFMRTETETIFLNIIINLLLVRKSYDTMLSTAAVKFSSVIRISVIQNIIDVCSRICFHFSCLIVLFSACVSNVSIFIISIGVHSNLVSSMSFITMLLIPSSIDLMKMLNKVRYQSLWHPSSAHWHFHYSLLTAYQLLNSIFN